jgi:cytochrome c oxidase subunit II
VFSIYVPIAIGVFVVVAVMVLFALVKYRRRAPSEAARWHENNRAEGTYAAVLVLTIAFLLWLTYTAEHRVDTVANREKPNLTINVTGTKWEWTFRYPAYGITLHSGTTGDAAFVVPTGEAIRFTLTSLDVIHAFWIPQLRYKRDLIPGRTQSQILTFSQAGHFTGQCAEYCGLRHADMVFKVVSLPPAQFQRWAASGGKAPLP